MHKKETNRQPDTNEMTIFFTCIILKWDPKNKIGNAKKQSFISMAESAADLFSEKK
jgi:hypothetical protein